MKINKLSLFVKVTVTSLMLVAGTVNANESSTIDSLLELLFPSETIIEQKHCDAFPNDCPSKKLLDTEETNSED